MSALIQSGKINPAGVVSAGGPTGSMAALAVFQLKRHFYIQAIEKAYAVCHEDDMSSERIVACGGIKGPVDHRDALREFAGGDRFLYKDLPQRRQLFDDVYRLLLARFTGPTVEPTIDGRFAGQLIPIAWSGKYYTELITSSDSTLKMLEHYKRKVIYLFGQHDHLIPMHSTYGQEYPEVIAKNRSIVMIPNVGHGLESVAGKPTTSLPYIISSLQEAQKP